MATLTLTVPDIGGAEGAEVVEVLVAVGDTITLEQSLIVLESDKASMEIPATAEGKILTLKVAVGDALSEGDAIVEIDTDGAEASAAPAPQGAAPSANPATVDEPQAADSPTLGSEASESTQISSAPAAELAEMTVEVPDVGTDGDVDLVEVLVTTGQEVAEGDSLVLLESDKASMEVPAPAAGKIADVLVSAGKSVRQGTPLMTMAVLANGQSAAGSSPQATTGAGNAGTPSAAPKIEAQLNSGSVSASAPETANSSITTETPIKEVADASAIDDGATVYAGPAVRKLAREFGVDLLKVTGTGPRGRIVKEDLHHYVQQALKTGVRSADLGAGIPGIPEVDFSQFGVIEETPRSRLDKVTASNMARSWLNVPHVTQFDDADITDLEDFRSEMKQEAEKRGTKLTPMPFILKACAVALGRHPKLKTSLSQGGETLIYKHYCHIGMAVDTPAGLMVPVIRDVEKKGLWELSEEMTHLAALARDKKLKPDQMQGGVFTISSLGNIGGRGFTPIVNAPEVAILGVSRATIQPVWTGSEFEPRKQLPLSLSYDHRVINGGDAGRFLTELVALLSDIRRALL